MKKLFVLFYIIGSLLSVTATEYNLYRNVQQNILPQISVEEFIELSLEDQYTSYLSSFSYVGELRGQELTYSRLMVEKYGREVLSYIDRDLKIVTFYNIYRKPYDDRIGFISDIISNLNKNKFLTEEEIKEYIDIYEKKLDEYVKKFKIIDGTVYSAIRSIVFIGQREGPEYFGGDAEDLKNYFEKKLGITDIVAGNRNSRWEE